MKRLVAGLSLAFIAFSGHGMATAQTAGITFTDEPTTFTTGLDGTRGWEFTVLQSVFVTSLGLYDHGGDGFGASHQIGLWGAGSALFASLVMPQGSAGFLGADSFRYLVLGAPVFLAPGTYRIGAHYAEASPDVIAQSAGPVGATGYITYDGPRLFRNGFDDPLEVSAVTGGAFGPNFIFETELVQVPEPFSAVLLGTGLLGLAVIRSRRRNDSNA
jgi:hypothetical protein